MVLIEPINIVKYETSTKFVIPKRNFEYRRIYVIIIRSTLKFVFVGEVW